MYSIFRDSQLTFPLRQRYSSNGRKMNLFYVYLLLLGHFIKKLLLQIKITLKYKLAHEYNYVVE